jgi:hypothetical protein
VKKLIIIFIFLFVGCDLDMSVKQMLESNYPESCKWVYVCWKANKGEKNKAACEKFAIPCATDLKGYNKK